MALTYHFAIELTRRAQITHGNCGAGTLARWASWWSSFPDLSPCASSADAACSPCRPSNVMPCWSRQDGSYGHRDASRTKAMRELTGGTDKRARQGASGSLAAFWRVRAMSAFPLIAKGRQRATT